MFNIFFYFPFPAVSFMSALTHSCDQWAEYDFPCVISSQGDLGEDGPKGDLGEKVCTFHFNFPPLCLWLGTCTEKQKSRAVAVKHKKAVHANRLRGDLWKQK